MSNENWAAVPGYEGLYEVSDQGKVRSLHGRVPRLLSPGLDGTGYIAVNLCRGGLKTHSTIHRLVALAFLGQPPTPRHEVRHLDGTRTNNWVGNLAWGTRSKNQQDRLDHGRHWRARLNRDDVAEIRRLLDQGVKQVVIASRFGVAQPTVSEIARGVAWRRAREEVAQ